MPTIEHATPDDHRSGSIAILEHYLHRVRSGDVVGVMVVAETIAGGCELKQSASVDAYGRLGRLAVLSDMVMQEAVG